MLLHIDDEKPDTDDPQALSYYKKILYQIAADQEGLVRERRINANKRESQKSLHSKTNSLSLCTFF